MLVVMVRGRSAMVVAGAVILLATVTVAVPVAVTVTVADGSSMGAGRWGPDRSVRTKTMTDVMMSSDTPIAARMMGMRLLIVECMYSTPLWQRCRLSPAAQSPPAHHRSVLAAARATPTVSTMEPAAPSTNPFTCVDGI